VLLSHMFVLGRKQGTGRGSLPYAHKSGREDYKERRRKEKRVSSLKPFSNREGTFIVSGVLPGKEKGGMLLIPKAFFLERKSRSLYGKKGGGLCRFVLESSSDGGKGNSRRSPTVRPHPPKRRPRVGKKTVKRKKTKRDLLRCTHSCGGTSSKKVIRRRSKRRLPKFRPFQKKTYG